MRLIDSRRLTGPNLLWNRPGAVIDVSFGDVHPDLVVGAWQAQVRRLLDEVEWREEQTCVRRFDGGASLAISAPVDCLYTATDINEAAWDAARDLVSGGSRNLLAWAARQLRNAIRDEERPRLRRLLDAARERGLPAVLDTDAVSIGLGCRSQCWDLYDVPHPDDVDWSGLGRVPVALVTGTNGKTTTVRLLGAIGAAAGHCTGISSTDWLAVGGEIIERDDYAGPEGARRVLRDPRTELAILETARGGMLRRGLALPRADAALITNIASDHLGEFGVQDLEQLADVKWIVTRALDDDGILVLNAEDERLRRRAAAWTGKLIWFSPQPSNPLLKAHAAANGTVFTLDRGRVVMRRGKRQQAICTVRQVPITFGGAARHNVFNVLGACALAHALGIPPRAIADGLRRLEPDDNPGRVNVYQVKGARVLLDFAHNPHGLEAVIDMARALPARRRILVIGQAGDRTDEDIRDLARVAARLDFDRILIKRLDKYARGREPGEAARILRAEFIAQGVPARRIGSHIDELAALRAALRWLGPDDLAILLVHERRDEAIALLRRLDGRTD